MIDHLSLPVADRERSRAFYDRVLATLGHRRVMDLDEDDFTAAAYGPSEQAAIFWVVGDFQAPVPPTGQHIAFAAADRASVDAFYREALDAGGRDNGPPGLRPEYHPSYYAAFVIDPDGHHIEAVCHKPG